MIVGVVLEVMWGTIKPVRWYRINPYNHSGRRLITLIGHDDFLVTNACERGVRLATQRGIPSAAWLRSNLNLLRPDVLLVCGNVAQATFTDDMTTAKVLRMLHPAARTWTKAAITQWQRRIARAINT